MQAARLLNDDVDPSSELIARYQGESPERQALLLIALGDLGNKASLPAER